MYDDNFSPIYENDVDDIQQQDQSQNKLKKNKSKKPLDAFKKLDSSYVSFNRIVMDEKDQQGNKKKLVNIECYKSCGTLIKDAISGISYKNMLIGSPSEDLFFKVRMCTFEKDTGNEMMTFFYSSPEAYERHQYKILDQRVKDKWTEKYNNAVSK